MKTGLLLVLVAAAATCARAQSVEYNAPVRTSRSAVQTTDRVIVKWRSDAISARSKAQVPGERARQLSASAGIALKSLRPMSEDLEVMQLPEALSGAALQATLEQLRNDPGIQYVAPDLRRHAHAIPNDPLVVEQWYFLSAQAAAARADEAWDVTQGHSGTVVAVLDTGVRFEHPDLGRLSQGGKLLPGYDFVAQVSTANDSDGRDSDPSDPGDWVSATDIQQPAFQDCEEASSSWHGTRVSGLIGALTNNAQGVAGASWNSLLLPVRVLGKCGGFDADIIDGMRWAAGLAVSGVPLNPDPAKIVNLSLGGEGACTPAYQATVNELSARGVLVVASVGNEGGPVSVPANCPGVLGVTGLRHIGTKVGFSSLGTEAGIGAPGGNCVNAAGQPCLFSIVVPIDSGTTGPVASGYTDQFNFNVGTSFSAPIVAGAAALMHAVNSRLTAAQMIAVLKESSTPFPTSADPGIPACRVPADSSDLQTSECNCTAQTCGAGMLNTNAAVLAAQRPFAIVQAASMIELNTNASIDGVTSFGSNGRSIASYQWSAVNVTGAVPTIGNPTQASTSLLATGSSHFTLRLTVTDDQGGQDTADVAITTAAAPTPTPTPTPAPGSGGGGGGGNPGWLMIGVMLALRTARQSRAHRAGTE